MASATKRAGLVLTQDQEAMRRRLAGSRTAPVREVERAKVLLGYAQGIPITDLARQIGVSRPSVYTCIDKALASGVAAGLADAYHRPREPEISDEARAWVIALAVRPASSVPPSTMGGNPAAPIDAAPKVVHLPARRRAPRS